MSKNLVSIIMNCYNGEQYIKQAIDSIYAQTYSNWEIIRIMLRLMEVIILPAVMIQK